MPEPHEYCYIHMQVEEDREDDYKACLECGHVWRNKVAFELDVRKLEREMGWPESPNPLELPFCPLCSHDW